MNRTPTPRAGAAPRRSTHRVTIGIQVHGDRRGLEATAGALDGFDVVVLEDDPPAGFNRIAGQTTSDVVILLESGAVPAPGALLRLAAALIRHRDLGLAGPATNSAWNAQCVFPRCSGAPVEVARIGALAAARHGDELRDLTPLHSLSDFCFAVRRDVIDAIGGADEAYGLGPCWEMEYSARAVRAGFRTAWLPGAFVYRAQPTERRRREEARAFEASRRRYQDSLCGLRLRGERADYEPHCRGEACEHFAPRELIRLRRPLPQPAPRPPTRLRAPGRPLVSCIMPTRDRVELALQAVRLFQRQDYEPRELVIVDAGTDGLAGRLPGDPRIRYIRAGPGETLGEQRNRACAAARGSFIAQWDDDDWYGERRLSCQLGPLIAGDADITGLSAPTFFELRPWRFWTVDEHLHHRLFRGDVLGGTLVYARRVWERLARYPPRPLAEDAFFLLAAQARGARLRRLPADQLFVYVRHGANTWRFGCGEFLDRTGWRAADEPPFPPEDRAFYAARSPAAPAPPDRPLVSCIMPTADRRRWVPLAIDYFRRQDYANRELVVLDDGEDRVADLVPADPRIRYVALDGRHLLGDKRNLACELARGELIVHWDDDDWQAPHRLSYQVAALQAHGAALCGTATTLYFAPAAARAWLYRYPAGRRDWVAGSALCYRRSLWQGHPFASVGVGEDTRFVWSARIGRPLLHDDHRFFAALIHDRNSSPKRTDGAYWEPRELGEVRDLLGPDWHHYMPPTTA